MLTGSGLVQSVLHRKCFRLVGTRPVRVPQEMAFKKGAFWKKMVLMQGIVILTKKARLVDPGTRLKARLPTLMSQVTGPSVVVINFVPTNVIILGTAAIPLVLQVLDRLTNRLSTIC